METQPTNPKYKDSLFKFIYGREENKKWLMSLYNALANSNCTDENELEITTIEDIIYVTRKNDVSFMIGSEMYLLEQQSSYNPNMPLRGLIYFSQLYHKFVTNFKYDIFGTRLIKIPAPKFYVLYNGNKDMPDKTYMHLSESFETPSEGFEWTATMLNINIGHNKELLEACKSLHDYALYVKMVRENIENKMEMADAVNKAVDEAIRLNLLNGFFKIHKSEVLNMCMTEFDQEKYDYSRYMEGYDEACEKYITIVAEKDNELAEKDNELAEKDNELAEKDNVIAEKDNELAEKNSVIARLQEEIRLLKSC